MDKITVATLKSAVTFYGKHIIPVRKWDKLSTGDGIEALRRLGIDVTGIEDTYYYDEDYGFGWNANNWPGEGELSINVPEGAYAVRVVYSGWYDNPSRSLGVLKISSVGRNIIPVLYNSDAWDDARAGQSLSINRNPVYSVYSRVDFVNREDIVYIGGASAIQIHMSDYNSYPYSKRYIKELEFIPAPVEYHDMFIAGMVSFWPMRSNTKNIGGGKDMISHGNIEFSDDGARLHTGAWLEFTTPDISQGFTYLIDIEVYDDHDPVDYIHLMCEYSTQYNFTFKMTSPNKSYPMKPYVYKYYRQYVTGTSTPIVSYHEKRVMAISSTGSNMKMFVDGVLIDEKAFTHDITYTHFRIGNWNGEAFSGMVRSVALYERDLSDDEIASVTQAMIAQRSS
jgi:hypothetical protein